MNIEPIIKILTKEVKKYSIPVAEYIKIKTGDPFKILVSTILSARTKDEVTYSASQRLFKKVKKFKDFDKYSVKQVQELIRPVNYYITKAKRLKQLSNLKKVPDKLNELVKLPGVGRKTANIVLSVAFDKDSIAVDVHVNRISNRLGYVNTKTPEQTEFALIEKLPRKYWKYYNYLLVVWGQNVCKPISPYCTKCAINKICKKIGVKRSR